MTGTRVHRCLESGLSIVVGSVDAEGTPSCCRAVALTSDDDLATVIVYLPVATSQQTIGNLATTRRLAVTASNPPDHSTTQLKGTMTDVWLAREDEAAFVRSQLDAFADVLDSVGVPRRVTRSITHWPAFAVRMRVEQVFEQTPGPKAGTRLQ